VKLTEILPSTELREREVRTGRYCDSIAKVWLRSCVMEQWQWVYEELHGLWGWGCLPWAASTQPWLDSMLHADNVG